jgi:hypothetical protein
MRQMLHEEGLKLVFAYGMIHRRFAKVFGKVAEGGGSCN